MQSRRVLCHHFNSQSFSSLSKISKNDLGLIFSRTFLKSTPYLNNFSSNINHSRNYTLALTRSIPNTFQDAISSSSSSSSSSISVSNAKAQHSIYEQNLRSVLYTFTLPPNDQYPDCPFIEDTVIAIQNRAVLNRIGTISREGEVEEVDLILKQLGMNVLDMRSVSEDAMCDGGDVLTISRGSGKKRKELFVGMSGRTNKEGIDVLEDAFSDIVEIIPVPDIYSNDFLHLKTVLTHLDGDTLVVPTGPMGEEVILAMGARERGYHIVKLPDPKVCNLLSVNGLVLAVETECEETRLILERAVEERNMELRYLNVDEFAKCDGSLTCLSVLLDLN